MSAVLKPAPVRLRATHPLQDRLLTPQALALLAGLHATFEPGRQARLAARRIRQAEFDGGALPRFRDDTAAIRAADWGVAPIPAALLDRRVEITGSVDPKMVINALNSGANCYMADFEDSTAPTWDNLLTGQQSLREAVGGTLDFVNAAGKRYALRPEDERAVLIVRPRGWHLDEAHLELDGAPMSAALFDAGLFLFHNARTLATADRGPYLYLPKLEGMEEAALWNDVLSCAESLLGLAEGQVKVTVLIETLPAAFEMDEILHALRGRVAGLNCGRWDYMFSYIKTLAMHPSRVLPERAQVTMAQPLMRAYANLLVRTCHRRGAHAMGGMAAQIPIANDPVANAAALARVRADKVREATSGHDGTWVAHPALVPIARDVFDAVMDGPNQHDFVGVDDDITADDLLRPCLGTVTRAGFDANVEVCVRYLAAWLDGQGCVPIHHLMEDAATAEIARAQLWQWLHHADGGCAPLHLDDGAVIDFELFDAALIGLPARLAAIPALPGAPHVAAAIGLLHAWTHAPRLEPFLTVPAYARIA